MLDSCLRWFESGVQQHQRTIDLSIAHTHTRTHRQTAIGRQRTHLTEIGLAQRQRKALRIGKTCDSIYSSSLNNNKRTTTTIATLSCSCIRLLSWKAIYWKLPCYRAMHVHVCACMCFFTVFKFDTTQYCAPSTLYSLVNQPNKQRNNETTNQLRVFEIKCKTFLKNCYF